MEGVLSVGVAERVCYLVLTRSRPFMQPQIGRMGLVSTWARIWARICPKDLPKAQSWPTGFFCVSKGNRAEDSLIMDGQDRKEDYKTT